MKRMFFLLTLVIYTLSTGSAFAKCNRLPVLASPKSTEMLPANASVIVWFSGDAIQTFNEGKAKAQKKFFFKNGDDKVEAELVWERDHSDAKVLYFRAVKKLEIGKHYSLLVNGTTFNWKIGAADTTAPKWSAGPKVIKFEKGDSEDGPRVSFVLSFDISDASPFVFEVIVKRKDGKTKQYVVTPHDGKIYLADSMCSIQFLPEPGTVAQMEMTPYDFAGNKGETKSLKLSAK